MTNDATHTPPTSDPAEPEDGRVQPLPGEPGIPNVATARGPAMSRKGLLAVALLVVSLVTVFGVSIARFGAGGATSGEPKQAPAANRPSAATAEPKRLDLAARPASPSSQAGHLVPAIDPAADLPAEPIGVRRTGDTRPVDGAPRATAPEDAPVLLVTSRPSEGPRTAAPTSEGHPEEGPLDETRRNLDAYQRQLRELMRSLDPSAPSSAVTPMGRLLGSASGRVPPNAGTSKGSLFGGQLEGSTTPRVAAGTLGDRSLTLPKGTAFTCALKTRVISATSGMVGCQVQRNVYGDDGRVLLIERGSHLDGEYRINAVRPGMVRIPVLWTRIRTPHGVTVDVESPGTGQLGESGIEGHVDNRWGERIGAAMLLSLIDDSVQLVVQNQTSQRDADTIVLPSTTGNTSKLAEKVLDSTINIPPLIYQNQGGIVGIYVARDVDFSSVYELRPGGPLEPR
ncbi:type IV secretion system protein VirB10 [Rubrivivax gelatinosus]|uniref:Type IV secretion system protein VirB10 n=1 Tax=Rubrivivax gelatinosus TaxID=28068 RepID=A0ABS1DRP2_RUBGE|nr:type IV secretion system protein VirB10 [Rubrivivax gelatinosus]MBK1712163.1 type IV secretion system protein VirB10 [Rubrivivax gelatinosus]